MKNLIISLILFLTSWTIVFPQSCLPDGIIFNTQAAIDNFQHNYPGCTEIGGLVGVYGNNISNLYGLSFLSSIGGGLVIWDTSLDSLTGLENVCSINGIIYISDNYNLSSLTGLDNIDPAYITDLYIFQNHSLSTCEVPSICEYLTNPNGIVNIYSNAIGCSNPGEIVYSWGYNKVCLPYGNYYFMQQSDIESFLSYNSECTDLKGNVIIGWHPVEGSHEINETDNENIKSSRKAVNCLKGLSGIKSIEGTLAIRGDHKLTNLTGLENLKSIGGNLSICGWVQNEYLTSLDGLNNLESIGGALYIAGNSKLTSLEGLQNLKSIGGPLEIGWRFIGNIGNNSLSSLKGLEKIDPASILNLKIIYNKSLSECEVLSICNYLAAPNGSIEICDNGEGCNNELEIEKACDLSTVSSETLSPGVTIYPNPAVNELNIIIKNGSIIERVTIFNQLGRIVLTEEDIIDTVDISALPRGLYLLEIIIKGSVERCKIILL